MPYPDFSLLHLSGHCIPITDAAPGLAYVHRAGWAEPLTEFTMRLHYMAHAGFLFQKRGGLEVVTDYTGFIGTVPLIPDVVAVNHADSSCWTANSDPAIPDVLPG